MEMWQEYLGAGFSVSLNSRVTLSGIFLSYQVVTQIFQKPRTSITAFCMQRPLVSICCNPPRGMVTQADPEISPSALCSFVVDEDMLGRSGKRRTKMVIGINISDINRIGLEYKRTKWA